jgi:hypothetical protein
MPDPSSSQGRRVFDNEVLSEAKGRALETTRRRRVAALELRTELANQAEAVMGVLERWKPGDKDYESTLDYIKHKEFVRACDALEGAIVSRDAEFWKANLSGTSTSLVSL